MTGALALLFLFTVTLAIVRVAGVALRLTGLPQPVARFQAISALTGTGFTTSEAEGTMHHPVRRRILTVLMFTGHLGLVSLTSTVILTMASTDGSGGAFTQILFMLGAVFVICALATSKVLDQAMCDWVGRLLTRLGWITSLPFEILYENPDGYQLGEHVVGSQVKIDGDAQLVSLNGVPLTSAGSAMLSAGDRVVIYAKQSDQLAWASGKFDGDQGNAE
ncbi:MAG: hypothetical protein ABJR46_01405 [Tateyamaria sp.]|uniref:hypothetical protein n=1 Tax=Tateyamaria sp. TaxID=1929288 RepID=UPI0032A0F97D